MSGPIGIAESDSWNHDQAFNYLQRLTAAVDSLGIMGESVERSAIDRVQRLRGESLAAIWRHRTTDFGSLYVACVCHRYEPGDDVLAATLAAYGLLDERGCFLTWGLHS